MKKETVERLVNEAVGENESLFLIELSFSSENKIIVIVDGDDGVPLKECMRISRHVEHNLDREEEDFALEVTTPGAASPIINKRQYRKNIGRILQVKTESENLEGTLIDSNDESITLEWKAREPKPIGKGKVTVVKNAILAYDTIKEAKVKIIF